MFFSLHFSPLHCWLIKTDRNSDIPNRGDEDNLPPNLLFISFFIYFLSSLICLLCIRAARNTINQDVYLFYLFTVYLKVACDTVHPSLFSHLIRDSLPPTALSGVRKGPSASCDIDAAWQSGIDTDCPPFSPPLCVCVPARHSSFCFFVFSLFEVDTHEKAQWTLKDTGCDCLRNGAGPALLLP